MKRMTPTLLLNKCKRKLGLKFFKLPMTDDELLEILYQDTLPVFSTYFPYLLKIRMNLKQCQIGTNTYRIPTSNFGDIGIIDVQNVDLAELREDPYMELNYMDQNLNAFEMFGYAQMEATVMSMLSRPITFHYHEPDILEVNANGFESISDASVDLLVTHPDSLATIKMTYMEYLTELYCYDLKITLYESLKRFDNIDTTFRQINLKIDDWQSAEGDRQNLLDKFAAMTLVHSSKKIIKC